MRRISAVWKGSRPSGAQGSTGPSPPSQPKDSSIKPPPSDSWVVDEQFLEESSLLIPASPEDVDDGTRQIFVTRAFPRTKEWVDFDIVMYELGNALDIFPNNSTFDSLKWVFWTENAVNRKLNNLVQALARPDSKCLECRNSPDYQFRKYVPPI